jgi:hypothetical protein
MQDIVLTRISVCQTVATSREVVAEVNIRTAV